MPVNAHARPRRQAGRHVAIRQQPEPAAAVLVVQEVKDLGMLILEVIGLDDFQCACGIDKRAFFDVISQRRANTECDNGEQRQPPESSSCFDQIHGTPSCNCFYSILWRHNV